MLAYIIICLILNAEKLLSELLDSAWLGTLDGFSFDSEDEAEKATAQADQNEAADEQPDAAETKKKPVKAAVCFLIFFVILLWTIYYESLINWNLDSGCRKEKGKACRRKAAQESKKETSCYQKGQIQEMKICLLQWYFHLISFILLQAEAHTYYYEWSVREISNWNIEWGCLNFHFL